MGFTVGSLCFHEVWGTIIDIDSTLVESGARIAERTYALSLRRCFTQRREHEKEQAACWLILVHKRNTEPSSLSLIQPARLTP